jgi:hypothetical protein
VTTAVNEVKQHVPAWVNVADAQYGYRAASAVLIDMALTGKRLPDAVIKQFLPKHLELFPAHDVGPRGLVTIAERFKYVVGGVNIRVLTDALTETLMALATDSIAKHPEHFAYAFAHVQNNPADLYLAALANSLNCSIELSVVEPQKEIPVKSTYNASKSLMTIAIKQEGSGFMPHVHQVGKMSTLANSHHAQKPSELSGSLKEKLSDALDKQSFKYGELVHKLSVMVHVGELHQSQLLMMYNGLINQDIEQGTQRDELVFASAEQKIPYHACNDMIFAIASSMVLSQTTIEKAFDLIADKADCAINNGGHDALFAAI